MSSDATHGIDQNMIHSKNLAALQRLRPEMFALLEEMARIQLRKAGEYAKDTDCYSNYTQAALDTGIEPWRYVQGRAAEKYQRHVELTLKNKFSETDGGYRESAIDQASCWLIGCILFEREELGTNG